MHVFSWRPTDSATAPGRHLAVGKKGLKLAASPRCAGCRTKPQCLARARDDPRLMLHLLQRVDRPNPPGRLADRHTRVRRMHLRTANFRAPNVHRYYAGTDGGPARAVPQAAFRP